MHLFELGLDEGQALAHLDIRYPDKPSHGLLIKCVEDPHGKDQRRAIEATQLELELGWRAQETFENGLEATID